MRSHDRFPRTPPCGPSRILLFRLNLPSSSNPLTSTEFCSRVAATFSWRSSHTDVTRPQFLGLTCPSPCQSCSSLTKTPCEISRRSSPASCFTTERGRFLQAGSPKVRCSSAELGENWTCNSSRHRTGLEGKAIQSGLQMVLLVLLFTGWVHIRRGSGRDISWGPTGPM